MLNTASEMLEAESAQPEQRPDLPNQNIEAVRFGVSRQIRELVSSLNRVIKDAKTCGLDVHVYQVGPSGVDGERVYVSIYENRKY